MPHTNKIKENKMKVYALIWEADYEGQQLIGVFSTREAATAANPENVKHEYFVHELDLDKVYEFQQITAGGDTHVG